MSSLRSRKLEENSRFADNWPAVDCLKLNCGREKVQEGLVESRSQDQILGGKKKLLEGLQCSVEEKSG